MSATISISKHEATNRFVHINDVNDDRTGFTCSGCGKELVVVKSEARKKDWHFRHFVETLCTGDRDTALHDYAEQIIMENTEISISEKININYFNPRWHVTFFNKFSDVTVTYENKDVHFEVFVTHDLDKEKIDTYKNNKIKCVRINLSYPELLSASPEKIKDELLNQHENKTIIYWQDEIIPIPDPIPAKKNSNWKFWLIIPIIVFGSCWIYNKWFKQK